MKLRSRKKQRRAKARKAKRARPFEAKESYRWVEAMPLVEQRVAPSTRIIHVFDREGDIAEVFEKVGYQLKPGQPLRIRVWAFVL